MCRVGFMLGALLILAGALAVPALAQESFTDVPAGHWAYNAVTKLAEAGLMEGYPDGQFKGNQPMTRYEFAQAIARIVSHLEEMKGVPGPAGPPGPAGAGGGLTAAQQALLDRLANEFAPELRALRSDLDKLTKRVADLEARCAERGPGLPAAEIPAGSSAGFPMPSLAGPTGIVTVPNALIAPRSLEAALSYQLLADSNGMYSEDDTVWSLQALAGVAENGELWASYSTIRDGGSAHMWGVGGKLALMREPQNAMSLALGASYQQLSDSIGMYDVSTGPFDMSFDEKVTKAYLVATKDFTPGAGMHALASAGLMYMQAKASVDALGTSLSESESLTRPFVGLEFIAPSGTGLGLEYRWKDDTLDADAVMSAALRLALSDQFRVEIGTTNADPMGFGMDDQNLFFRLGYSVPLS